MKGRICVLVGALLVVFSLTMVAEAQRKNRIRGNQGRRSVGKSGTTIQRNRKGKSSFRDIVDGSSNTLRRDQRGVERNRLGAGATSYPIQRKPGLILDDTTNPSVQKKPNKMKEFGEGDP